MNFFQILKKIIPVASTVEHYSVPVVSMLYPPATPILMKLDNLVSHVQSTMVTLEQQAPETVTGEQKAAAAITDFNAYILDLKSSLGLAGKTVSYDQAELQAAITAQHDAYNHFAKVKASIKVE